MLLSLDLPLITSESYPNDAEPRSASHHRLRRLSPRRSQRSEDGMRSSPVMTSSRSMPCLRLPVVSSSVSSSPRSPTFEFKKPGPPVSYRRSVAAMKGLMPLRLQSPPMPSVDLCSWLNKTMDANAPNVSCRFISDDEVALDHNHIPWMHSPQDSQMLNDVFPGRYRETPIYSEPGSPMLARAYFSEEDACYECPPPGAACEELRIVSSYEESSDSGSLESFTDCSISLHESKPQNLATKVSMSFISSRTSALSIQCIGQKTSDGKTGELKDKPRLAPAFEMPSVDRVESDIPDKWIDSDSSRCSSPDSSDELCDAFATPLAPAKAQVVDVNTSPKILPPRTTSLQYRPATPFQNSPRRKTTIGSPPITPPNSGRKTLNRQRSQNLPRLVNDDATVSGAPISQMDIPLSLPSVDLSAFTPPRTPSSVKSIDSFAERLRRQRSFIRRTEFEEDETITNRIRNAIEDYPRGMLTLESSSVIEIRQINQQSRACITAANNCVLSTSLGDVSLSEELPRPSLRRRTKVTNLFAPLKHTASVKSKYSRREEIDPLPSSNTEASSTTSWSDETSSLPPADLSSLQSIFPQTSDWLRGILYAHLVAYNYVGTLHKIPRSPKSCKVYRQSQLGLFPYHRCLADIADGDLDSIMEGLSWCITRITNCMAGKSKELSESDTAFKSSQVDLTIVRALAEIVRCCESRIDTIGL